MEIRYGEMQVQIYIMVLLRVDLVLFQVYVMDRYFDAEGPNCLMFFCEGGPREVPVARDEGWTARQTMDRCQMCLLARRWRGNT